MLLEANLVIRFNWFSQGYLAYDNEKDLTIEKSNVLQLKYLGPSILPILRSAIHKLGLSLTNPNEKP